MISPMKSPRISIASIALTVGLVAGLMLLSTGPGYRIGLLPLRSAFDVLRWGAYLGAAAAVLAIVALVRKRAVITALAALLVGLFAFALPLRWQRTAAAAPPIHDITTDTNNPPAFAAIVPLRADAPNTLDYPPETARQQQEAYPELKPLLLDAPPAQVFDRALQVAREAGWEIVAADPTAGRIEATDTTRWFGFKDDIVVRLTPAGTRTVVDVRSVSRLGRGDTGTNARRIRDYLAALSR
jgi:uncharacterized protein (DUF1499 family)